MRWLHWIPFLGYSAVIFAYSHRSQPPGVGFGPDYLLHAVGYAGLGLTLVWAWTFGLEERLTFRRAGLAWITGSIHGVLDEFHQWFIPDRHASLSDVAADSVGVALAVGLAWLVLNAVWSRTDRAPG